MEVITSIKEVITSIKYF